MQSTPPTLHTVVSRSSIKTDRVVSAEKGGKEGDVEGAAEEAAACFEHIDCAGVSIQARIATLSLFPPPLSLSKHSGPYRYFQRSAVLLAHRIDMP